MGAATELAPGTVLSGTYEVVRRIGAGGMGAVYEAKHLRLAGRRVAVKVLLGDFARDAETFARFRREAEIGARIGHPNIIVVTDWDKLPDGSPFMVMEMLDGEDLDKRIHRERLTAAQIQNVVREIGSALSAAHKQGIVHRDLKPHNIFLTPVEEADGVVDRVKILDFGISKIAASQTVKTQESSILGTPQYMAPEQALGKSDQIDARTDQFAFATIVYEMYAGRPAFKADSLTAVLFKVVYEAAPPLREVAPEAPPHVVAAVERAMAKDRGARFADVGAFVHALTSDDGGRAADTLKDRPPVGRRLGTWVTAVAAMVLLLGGGGVLAIRSMRDRPPPDKFAFTKPPPSPPPPVAIVPAAPPVTVAPPAPPVVTKKPTPPVEKPVVAVAKPAATTEKSVGPFVASNPSTPPASKPAAPGENAKVSPMLDEAQSLLDGGKWELARVRANQSLGHQETPRARRIIFLSYCGQQDLGGANSALGQVSDKKPATKRCRALFPDF